MSGSNLKQISDKLSYFWPNKLPMEHKQIYISKSEFDKSKCALGVAFLHCPRGKSIYKCCLYGGGMRFNCNHRVSSAPRIHERCKSGKFAKHRSQQRINHCCVEFEKFAKKMQKNCKTLIRTTNQPLLC